jgi:L-ascorbate metabolism protein UlaG (beta-lactamase superfamily)
MVRIALRLAAIAALPVLIAACSTRYHGPVTGNFDGRRFHNPGPPEPANLLGLLRWQLLDRGDAVWPAWRDIVPDRPPPRVDGDAIRISYVGHATVLVQTAGLNILTDPVYSERASPLAFAGPRRIHAPGVAFDDLPPIDVVLVSHNHYDHLDTATLARLWRRDRPLMVAPLANAAIMRTGAPDMAVTELDWGRSLRTGAATITAEPMQHWSARTMFDRNLSLWAAFVVETPGGRLYFVGDSGYGDGGHFLHAARRHGPMRLAILPIGAYEPRWFMQYAHMKPEESVQAGLDACAAHVLGHHWGTFKLSNEAIDEPAERFAAAARERGVDGRFRTLSPGGVWDVPGVAADVAAACKR